MFKKIVMAAGLIMISSQLFANTFVEMKTSKGVVEIELYNDKAPVSAKNFENYALEFETDETLEYYPLENDLLSNQSLKIHLEEKTLPLTYLLFENDALVLKKLNSNSILLKENNLPVLNFSFKDFPNFGIWTKINAPFICLEPWVGYADTIKSSGNILEKEGIALLEPKKNDTFTFSITIL